MQKSCGGRRDYLLQTTRFRRPHVVFFLMTHHRKLNAKVDVEEEVEKKQKIIDFFTLLLLVQISTYKFIPRNICHVGVSTLANTTQLEINTRRFDSR